MMILAKDCGAVDAKRTPPQLWALCDVACLVIKKSAGKDARETAAPGGDQRQLSSKPVVDWSFV
jgi:hypothetical protein